MHFLKKYDRWMDSSISYEDLLRFSGSVVVYDKMIMTPYGLGFTIPIQIGKK